MVGVPEDVFPGDVVKIAEGKTDLYEDWKPPDGRMYKKLLDVDDIVAVMWMQGERDARTGYKADSYSKNLDLLISSLREKYGDIIFIAGRINPERWGYGYQDTVREAIEQERENYAFIDCDDLTKIDPIHYSKEGLDELARRFVAKYMEMR